MPENEMAAIAFLRRALSTSKREKPKNGNTDAGWCCQEHAVTSSMMLCSLGKRAMCCSGSVIIGDTRLALTVSPHYFVVLDGSPLKIFDSSISWREIQGIPSDLGGVYGDFSAKLSTSSPDQVSFLKWIKKSGSSRFAYYGVDTASSRLPSHGSIKWRSANPIGEEINEILGSQDGFWSRVAYIAGQIYIGDTSFETFDLSGPPLWKLIASTPNRDDYMIKRFNLIS